VELDAIKELMANVESSKLRKVRLKKGDFELEIEKDSDHVPSMQLPPSCPQPRIMPVESHETVHTDHAQKTAKRPDGAVDGKFITSPMVGTFYSAPAPDQPSFVKIGDHVSENTVVCIVEAMKVMNEVKANTSGTVAEILVDTAHPVEFGTKIFRIV
jgi:acetyl-CoA carboxylase biotin carboxyl carrier protein